LNRLTRGALGWSHTVEHFRDEFGHALERHVTTSPRGVAACVEAPAKCATLAEWVEFVRVCGLPRQHPTLDDDMAAPPGAPDTETLH
jgi:hypothetical protein